MCGSHFLPSDYLYPKRKLEKGAHLKKNAIPSVFEKPDGALEASSRTDGEYSSIYTAQGLSSVIGREIVSVYPAINGMLDSCVRVLNTIVSPRIQRSNRRSRDRVYVLWTRMNGPFPQPQGTTWLPNHLVPLIGKDQVSPGEKTSSPISVDSLSPYFIQSPLKSNMVEDKPSTITTMPSPSTPPVSVDSPSLNFIQSPLKTTPTDHKRENITLSDHSVSDCQTTQESNVVEDEPSAISPTTIPPPNTPPGETSSIREHQLDSQRSMSNNEPAFQDNPQQL